MGTWGSIGCQFKKISFKVNTIQWEKISSNENNGEFNLPEDIKNWIVASYIDLLSAMESLSPPKRRVWVMRESFFSKRRLSILFVYNFVCEIQSLIKKVSAVMKKVSCRFNKLSRAT